MKPMRILLVDDHEIFREGLRAVLDLKPNCEVVAEAGTVESAIEAYLVHKPDVTLMDLRLPDGTGLDALEKILETDPSARILMLTTYDGDEDIHRAMSRGASGYLLKSIPGSQLVEALVAVHEGRHYMPPAVLERLAERAAFEELTKKETEVLGLVAKGLSNKDVARMLACSEFTVKAHVRSILGKLGVEARTEAAMLAVQRGLLPL